MVHYDALSPTQAFLARYKSKGQEPLDTFTPAFDVFFGTVPSPDTPTPADTIDLTDLSVNLTRVPYRTLRSAATDYLRLIRPLQVSPAKIGRFVERIFGEYNFVPYHNFAHGLSVMQLFSLFSRQHPAPDTLFDETHFFFSCVAALSHDAGHFGKNNGFCVAKQHPLAIKASNKAVLERSHIKRTLYALKNADANLLSDYPPAQAAAIRETITETILGTDMAVHNDLLKRFQETKREDFGLNSNFLSGFLVHCGDLGNMGLPWDGYMDWARLVLQEFHTQTLSETKNGLPVSKFMVYSGFHGIISDQMFFGSGLTRHLRAAAFPLRRGKVRLYFPPGHRPRKPEAVAAAKRCSGEAEGITFQAILRGLTALKEVSGTTAVGSG